MTFNRSGHIDDLLFLIALLLPAVFGGARYLDSDGEMTRIAQAQQQSVLVADDSQAREYLHLAYAQSHGR
jgi:hypothetical protein